MNIKLIHVYYTLKGGEDNVFEQEFDLLSDKHSVSKISFKNRSGIVGLFQFIFSVWNYKVGNKLYKQFISEDIDIVHIHNWHFAAGPIIINAARKANVPVVVTLHNYRLLCPSATLLYNNEIFLDSVCSKFPWKAIKNKVYRKSYIQTFWLSFINWVHRKLGTWRNVSKYIVLTSFSKSIFVQSSLGLEEDRFKIKPNFVYPNPLSQGSFKYNRSNTFLFVGRLYEEKGIRVLIEAFKNTNLELRIAGDGYLKQYVLDNCSDNIVYIGNLDKQGVAQEMLKCTALIFPSIWYEGMPMTMIEAFSLGTPIIASDLGAMSSMVENEYNGLHFITGDSNDLLCRLNHWLNLDEIEKNRYKENAFKTYIEKYTPDTNLMLLENIYIDCINSVNS